MQVQKGEVLTCSVHHSEEMERMGELNVISKETEAEIHVNQSIEPAVQPPSLEAEAIRCQRFLWRIKTIYSLIAYQ